MNENVTINYEKLKKEIERHQKTEIFHDKQIYDFKKKEILDKKDIFKWMKIKTE